MDSNSIFSLLEKASVYSDQSAMNQLQYLSNADQRIEAKGFALSLITILQTSHSNSSSSIRPESRLMAAIIMKNLVKNMWVTRSKSSIDDPDKLIIRNFIINHLGESDNRVATQLALTAAKICRHDWPLQWPDVLSRVYEHILNENDMIKLRAMNMLHEILLELTSR